MNIIQYREEDHYGLIQTGRSRLVGSLEYEAIGI